MRQYVILKNLLNKTPNSKDIIYNLASTFKSNGELVKAKFYFNKLLKIDDKNIKSYLLLGEVLCDTHSLNQGLKLFKKAINLMKRIILLILFYFFIQTTVLIILQRRYSLTINSLIINLGSPYRKSGNLSLLSKNQKRN